ncbi:MAG: Ldh family oxidoreductase [Alphaproteobacteria bacterium]|nr:Ldh family oxidoreductase [Alphaproteobacteria bacterium]
MAERQSGTDRVYASAVAADAFARSLLQAHGVPPEDAATIAGCLVSADLRGVDTHGLCRLPIYLERVRKGLINPKPDLKPERTTPVAAALDGQNGFGFVIGMRAMAEAISMAREFGIGVVAARRSTHFGMAASYALPAIEAGLMAMVFSNASRAMPPWGSKRELLGTNPFCMAAPAGRHRPVILDMSPAVAARGKIRKAERRGEKIPLGYALDAEGRPTTDPKAALAGGVVLPIGEHKGSGLAMFMDIFGGVISGANFGGDVADQYKAFDRPQDVGHFFLAMKPNLFVTEEQYRARIDTLIERMKASPLAEGVSEVLVPGEPEDRVEAERRRKGIPYASAEVSSLLDEAGRAGVQPLVFSDRPMA